MIPRLILLTALLVLSAGAAHAAAEDPVLAGDERLSRTVSVSRAHVYLGELLEELSAQSRVPVSVDDAKGPVSGIQLTVFVKDQPLRDVLSGLRELLAQRHNRWEWQKRPRPSGAEGASGYVLRCQRSPADAAATARTVIGEQWAKDLRRYYEIARLPEPARSRQAAAEPNGVMSPVMLQNGLPDLVGLLTPAQLDLLIKGDAVTIDPNGLSPRARDALKLGLQDLSGFRDTQRVAPGFYVNWTPDYLGPVLWVRNEFGLSTTVVGGPNWDQRWLRTAADGWLHAEHPEVQQQHRAMLRKAQNGGAPLSQLELIPLMKRLAQEQNIQFLCDQIYPRGAHSVNTSWQAETLEQSLASIVRHWNLNWKRHRQLQLLRDQSAITHPRSHLVRWAEIRSFRQVADANDGYLDLEKLLELAQLDAEQLDALSKEFPNANPELLREWKPILEFHSRLSRSQQAAIQQPGGTPYRNTGLVARNALMATPDTKNVRGLRVLAEQGQHVAVFLRVERPVSSEASVCPDETASMCGEADAEAQALAEAKRQAEERNRNAALLIWEIRRKDEVLHRQTLRLHRRQPPKVQ